MFTNVPDDWHVVVTDVMDSSLAVKKGLHSDINLSAVGSIISVLNEVKSIDTNIGIPYFFGGDGATFLVPNVIINQVMETLESYSKHIFKIFKLVLRIGEVQLCDIYKNGVSLRISKLRQNKYMTTPVVLGNGLKYAENIIKENFKLQKVNTTNTKPINLEGMECRWDKILPEAKDKKVVCLLIKSQSEDKQAEIFSTIMTEINHQFGDLDARRPIHVNTLKLDNSVGKIRKEMFARIGKFDRKHLIKNWAITFFGTYYFKFLKMVKII